MLSNVPPAASACAATSADTAAAAAKVPNTMIHAPSLCYDLASLAARFRLNLKR